MSSCVKAKLPPATAHAGQTSSMRFHPASTQRRKKGITNAKRKSSRPIIALKLRTESPVTDASATTGVPSAANATGTVLPSNVNRDALRAGIPNPISIAVEMATGVPKPAAPSINAPKQKAISST